MGEVIRLHCPPAGKKKEERVKILFDGIRKWVYSDPLKELVELYGGRVPEHMQIGEYIGWLNEFADVWDFRKKQPGGGERWTVADDEKCQGHRELILRNAHLLGMADSERPNANPDFILPLGGARRANLARAQGAREMAGKFSDSRPRIVALTGRRPLHEVERPYLEEYAPNARDEYEAMNGGLEKAFGLSGCEYLETTYVTENINLQWAKREYMQACQGCKIYSVAAPSSDPGRRANSFDTFQFFMERFEVNKAQRLLLVTSCIYAPFQLLKFIPLSLERDIEVDVYGVAPNVAGSQFSKPSNYLQEIKGAINAISQLNSMFG